VNTLVRWGKFNVVGAMGMAVQLGALALLNRIVPGHYLLTTAAAIEVTLVHNFIWHLHYTWPDRRNRAEMLAQCVRFHLSNGLVSIVGNLVLMRVLVEETRMPLLAANGIAIVCCSIVNFVLGNNWAFAASAPAME
jgi:putative flippase GtrA